MDLLRRCGLRRRERDRHRLRLWARAQAMRDVADRYRDTSRPSILAMVGRHGAAGNLRRNAHSESIVVFDPAALVYHSGLLKLSIDIVLGLLRYPDHGFMLVRQLSCHFPRT
jgi:hypothetical protein